MITIELEHEVADRVVLEVLKADYLMVKSNIANIEARMAVEKVKPYVLKDLKYDKKLLKALKRVLAYHMIHEEYETLIQEDKVMMNLNQLKQSLESGIVTVVFEKADGTLRKMRCTLQADILPPRVLQEDESSRAENLDRLAVWDIENGGWRSFRMDSIKSITVG
jgi:hypothetical protein